MGEYILAVTWTPLEAAQGRFHEKKKKKNEDLIIVAHNPRDQRPDLSVHGPACFQGPDTWLVAAEYSEFTDLSCRLVQEAQASSVATLTPLGDACVLYMGCECCHCHLCCPDER